MKNIGVALPMGDNQVHPNPTHFPSDAMVFLMESQRVNTFRYTNTLYSWVGKEGRCGLHRHYSFVQLFLFTHLYLTINSTAMVSF